MGHINERHRIAEISLDYRLDAVETRTEHLRKMDDEVRPLIEVLLGNQSIVAQTEDRALGGSRKGPPVRRVRAKGARLYGEPVDFRIAGLDGTAWSCHRLRQRVRADLALVILEHAGNFNDFPIAGAERAIHYEKPAAERQIQARTGD